MPRPGPRPYECVRRAWHSERHQPIRGSIIQQIFRVVSESHAPVTKKNKEWQEKLPVVVLKAEEIMYSKANSEAEYMDVDTLWDRVNDAINTIIRRDESAETGKFLPPCVEAALNLGCVSVRASRSQRNNNPRSYLSPRVQEPANPSRNLDNSNEEERPRLQQSRPGIEPSLERPAVPNPSMLVSESNQHLGLKYDPTTTCSFPFRLESSPPGGQQSMRMECNTSNFGTVYPLYYDTQYQSREPPQLGVQNPEISHSNNVLLGVPISSSIRYPTRKGILQSLFSSNSDENASEDLRNTHLKSHDIKCDLSLRLGLSPETSINIGKNKVYDTTACDSSCFQDESNPIDTTAQKHFRGGSPMTPIIGVQGRGSLQGKRNPLQRVNHPKH